MMTTKLALQRCLLLGCRFQSSLIRNTPTASRFHNSSRKQEEFAVQDTNDFNERVINEKGKLTIVDFHASWCGPCKVLAPRLTKALESVGDKVNLAKVDVDDNADLAMEYKVSSVPTVLFFKDGSHIDKFIGAIEQDRIEHYIEKYM